MKQTIYYEAFDTYGRWIGTATLAAIRKAGLHADLQYPMYGPETLGMNGWACRAAH